MSMISWYHMDVGIIIVILGIFKLSVAETEFESIMIMMNGYIIFLLGVLLHEMEVMKRERSSES